MMRFAGSDRPMNRLLLALAIVATSLAGCSDGPAAPTEDNTF